MILLYEKNPYGDSYSENWDENFIIHGVNVRMNIHSSPILDVQQRGGVI